MQDHTTSWWIGSFLAFGCIAFSLSHSPLTLKVRGPPTIGTANPVNSYSRHTHTILSRPTPTHRSRGTDSNLSLNHRASHNDESRLFDFSSRHQQCAAPRQANTNTNSPNYHSSYFSFFTSTREMSYRSDDDGSSTGRDLSSDGEEFEQVKHRFVELLPTYGTLFRSMSTRRNSPPLKERTNQCKDNCCVTSFVPSSILKQQTNNDGGSSDSDDSSSSSGESSIVRFDNLTFGPSPTSALEVEDPEQQQTFFSPSKADMKAVQPINSENNSKEEEQPVNEVIDLCSSSDEEEEALPIRPSRKTGRKLVIVDTSSSEEEQEDKDDSSSSQEGDDENDQSWGEQHDLLKDLTRQTGLITIESSDDDDDAPSTAIVPKKRSATAFKSNRRQLALDAFVEFDGAVFSNTLARVVTVEWNNKLRTTAGQTQLKRTGMDGSRTATVELSSKILDDESRLRATLLHEMCHAAAWVLDNNVKPPHGPVFQKWADRSMKFVSDVEVTTTHDYAIEFKYAWSCQTCSVLYKRHSRSIHPDKHVCSKCKGNLVEVDPKNTATPRKKKQTSAYNLFVKAHSATVRQRLYAETGQVTQQNVLKECGRLWKQQQQQDIAQAM
jgi:predicted SprT family Zn-dependent metalloprotease